MYSSATESSNCHNFPRAPPVNASDFHIYNDLQFPREENEPIDIVHTQNTESESSDFITGHLNGFRTRHLSCIEEIDSDSLHSTSIPATFTLMEEADKQFKCLHNINNTHNRSWSEAPAFHDVGDDNDDDHIEMIDESRLYDLDYLDELMSVSKINASPTICENDEISQCEELWQSTTSEPARRCCDGYQRGVVSDIMTTSCYGGLISIPFEDEQPLPPVICNSTPKKIKPNRTKHHNETAIYAIPDKQRSDCNSDIDLDQSQDSFIYNAMNTSLDLKNATINGSLHGKLFPYKSTKFNIEHSAATKKTAIVDNSFITQYISKEIAKNCIDAAEQDLHSIKRLLEYDVSSNQNTTAAYAAGEVSNAMESIGNVGNGNSALVCPSCGICFDKGKRRKLIDICGHERCYACMFRNDQCPMCLHDVENGNAQGYDTGIGGSTSTIVSPLGSPQPQLRSLSQRMAPHTKQNQQKHRLPLTSAIATDLPHYASVSTAKVPKSTVDTKDVLTGNMTYENSNNKFANSSSSNNGGERLNFSTAAFSTPPTRRRFFNHKNLRSAFVSHRRTASSGGRISGGIGTSDGIDNSSTLSIGKTDKDVLNTSTCSDSAVISRCHRHRKTGANVNTNAINACSENRLNRLSLAGTSVYAGHLSSLVFGKIKSLWSVNSNSSDSGLNQLADNATTVIDKQKEQLHTRLGLLLNGEHNDNIHAIPCIPNAATSISTSSSDFSQHIASEQSVHIRKNAHENQQPPSVPSVQEDLISLSTKLKTSLELSDSGEIFPIKMRKAPIRRSTRTHGTNVTHNGTKRNAIYKAANRHLTKEGGATACIQMQLPLKPLFFEVPFQEPDPPFIGRQWLLRELSNILMGTETPGVLINGQPGTGKTSLILQMVEYSCFGRRKNITSSGGAANDSAITNDTTNGIYCQINLGYDRLRALASHIVGYHFCQTDSNLTCLVPDFVHSLAAQLCQAPQLAAYRDYLLNEPHLQNILSVRECIVDAERVMRMGILEPLIILKRSGKIPAKTCIILVDALCEAEYHRPDHGYTIATFLAQMAQYFPCWLKVIATIRTQMLEHCKGLPYTKMTLDSWISNDMLQKDMLDYITFRINHSVEIQNNITATTKDHQSTCNSQSKFIMHLQTLSKGSMLFAKLTLDLIERGQLVIKSTSYKVLPVSLAQIFLLHFNLRFPTTDSFDRTSLILNVCLATLYPLTLNEIYYTYCAMKTDLDETRMSWNEFLARFRLLDDFLIKRIDNTYMFFHSSFREWLIRRDQGESSKFLCDLREGHAAIAFRLSRLQAPLDSEQTLELGHHMLKAHIYRNCQGMLSPRDMQAYWINSVADNISHALGSLRNIYSPNLKVSRLILLAGASPHFRTEFMGDATILCIAAHEGIVPLVSLLLEFGADVGLTNSQGCTPLILAAMRGHCDVVRQLVAAGSSLGQTDTTQRCALVHAARCGRLNVFKYLIACDWTPRSNSQDIGLKVALQQSLVAAAAQNQITILEDLLEMDDIDMNAIEIVSGDTALTAAARNGCMDAVSVLLARSVQVDGCNKQGDTSLWLAVKEAHWAIVEKLLNHGACIDHAAEPILKTPLMVAAEEGHINLLELLLDCGAKLEAQSNDGFTALSYACLRGHLNAAKCLIERGCHRQHADHNGRTALDLAAYQGSIQLVQYLLEQGGNIEHIDVNGMRPLDRAIACRNIQVVQVFLRRGAKLSPTTWSMAMGKPEILIVLLNKLLEDGNMLYRKNRYHEAAHRYQYALRKISNLENLIDRNAIFSQLRTNLLLNLSRCKRKLNELEESIDLATQAINQMPTSYEGYYARAKARIEQNAFSDALQDVNEAIHRATHCDRIVTQAEVLSVLKRIQAQLETNVTQHSNTLESLGDSIATTSASAAAANVVAASATVNESRAQEMTDL